MITYSTRAGWFFVCNEKGCSACADNFDSEAEAQEAYDVHVDLVH